VVADSARFCHLWKLENCWIGRYWPSQGQETLGLLGSMFVGQSKPAHMNAPLWMDVVWTGHIFTLGSCCPIQPPHVWGLCRVLKLGFIQLDDLKMGKGDGAFVGVMSHQPCWCKWHLLKTLTWDSLFYHSQRGGSLSSLNMREKSCKASVHMACCFHYPPLLCLFFLAHL
jgi:hypothetical protein